MTFASGCASETVASTSESSVSVQGLRVTDNGFTVVVIRGDAKITIDLERADRQDMDLIANPEGVEPFVTNFKVYNRSDYPFIIVGDGMLATNPQTGQVDIVQPGRVSQSNQLEDLHLVLMTIDLLGQHPHVGVKFQTDLKKLGYAANAALGNADAVYDGRITAGLAQSGVDRNSSAPIQGEGGVCVASQSLSTSSTFIQNFFIKYKQAYWVWGDHSSVKIDVYYSSGQYVGYLSTRNHGLEADDPSMSTSAGCPRQFTNRPTTLPPIQPFASTDTALQGDAGGCSTPYFAMSGVSAHVCNDDSLAMLHMAIQNAVISNDPTCSDYILRNYAPGCY